MKFADDDDDGGGFKKEEKAPRATAECVLAETHKNKRSVVIASEIPCARGMMASKIHVFRIINF